MSMEDLKYVIVKREENKYEVSFEGIFTALQIGINDGVYTICTILNNCNGSKEGLVVLSSIYIESSKVSTYIARHLLFYTIRYYSKLLSMQNKILSNVSALNIMKYMDIEEYTLENLFTIEKLSNCTYVGKYEYGLKFFGDSGEFSAVSEFCDGLDYTHGIQLNSKLNDCVNLSLFANDTIIGNDIIELINLYIYCEGTGD